MAEKTVSSVRKKNNVTNLITSPQKKTAKFSNGVKFPKKIVNHYIKNLEKKIKVEGVLLFGSFAWGKPTKHSDIDLVIISHDFTKKQFRNRLQWLSRMRDDITYQIAMDIIGYTPQEFANIEKESAIMTQAKKRGKWIYRAK